MLREGPGGVAAVWADPYREPSYVVGAGSVIGDRAYEQLDARAPAPLPPWLRRRLAPQPQLPLPRPSPGVHGDAPARLRGLVDTMRSSQPGDRTGPLVWAAHRLREMIAAGQADISCAEHLVQAAVAAGIDGGERYARYQVQHVLGGAR